MADRLEARTVQKRWTERTSYLVERDLLVGAFSVRKLIDSHKVSQQTTRRKFKVLSARLTGEPADPWTAYQYWENYDIANQRNAQLPLRDLTNPLIHSLVLGLSATPVPPHQLDGFIVASDYTVGTRIFFFPVDSVVEAFRSVADDDPLVWRMKRGTNGRRRITVLP
jgi:hypothetical protein